MSKIRYTFARLIIACILFALIGLVWFSGLGAYLTLQGVQCHASWLREQVNLFYVRTVIWYIVVYLTVVIASLPTVFVMNLLGGFLFGPWGVIYAIGSATVGAVFYFLIVRYAVGSYLQERYAQKMELFNHKLSTQGWFFLLLCRFIPIIPFFTINLLAGLLKIRLTTFLWTTAVGILPSTTVFVYVGRGLTTITSITDIFSLRLLGILVILILIFVVPMLVLHYRKSILQ